MQVYLVFGDPNLDWYARHRVSMVLVAVFHWARLLFHASVAKC